MEVGAVKQAFNNEVIHLKKCLNQARIQIIHKLTRKAKMLAEKKGPDNLKEKNNRKAKSAVNEVLFLKKVKTKDIAKFAVTHTGQLNDYLNKPDINLDKACARLLLHKALQEKYKLLRSRFANIPIKDLLMSRQERRKLKKEEKEKKAKKNKNKNNNTVSSEGDWNVEELGKKTEKSDSLKPVSLPDNEMVLDTDENSDVESDNKNDLSDQQSDESESVHNSDSNEDDIEEEECSVDDEEPDEVVDNEEESKIDHNAESAMSIEGPKSYNPDKEEAKSKNIISIQKSSINVSKKAAKEDNRKKLPKKGKDNKNKNYEEKIQSKKFKKDLESDTLKENKIVDPFFVTATGESYMSLVEPRAPDEVKEIHKEGNRRMRRAAQFGYAPRIKPKRDNFRNENNFNSSKFRQNDHRNTDFRNDKANWSKDSKFNNNKNDFKSRSTEPNNKNDFKSRSKEPEKSFEKSDQPEKLHPSWAAKKKMSSILPFQGKKIVFD